MKKGKAKKATQKSFYWSKKKDSPRVLISPGRHSSGNAIKWKVSGAGGSSRIIKPGAHVEEIVQDYEWSTHIILGGGGDVNPDRYGQDNVLSRGIDDGRDALEVALIAMAAGEEKPILGICRGSQILAVAMGAELIQDVAVELGASKSHYKGDHPIEITPGTWLRGAVKFDILGTNSLHHQSIEPLSAERCGFIVSAWSPDGVVEAVEMNDYPMIGIQSHPERLVTVWTWNVFRKFLDLK